MESVVTVYFYSIMSFVIAMAGTLICIRGFKKSKRKLFAFAAMYFAAITIYTAVFWMLQLFSSPDEPGLLIISNNISILFRYVSLGVLALMIWAFYRESQV